MVRELEKLVWGSEESVPVEQTITAVKHGGMVLGAFLGERLIGFQYSFAGYDGKKTYLCSHSLGIHPDYRASGIGYRLKLAQRTEAIRKGYDLITWTYDPLQTVNGNLNIRKLGAICSTYIENCYGDMNDQLNAGVPSDRFQVEWWITSDHVMDTLRKKRDPDSSVGFPAVIETTTNDQGFGVPLQVDLTLDQSAGKLLVPVPSSFQRLKEHDIGLAIEWRMKTRAVFSHYFQNGWSVREFVKQDGPEPVHYYVLDK
ncbi:GNAT family N-acetyltransferase [Brevibacillus sp. H7]|uniref:GNAT family N-acetyltransferase n=1 Tax=Brevibacillus sp. H7 TaxID=3349138 RepID=UPI0037FB719B